MPHTPIRKYTIAALLVWTGVLGFSLYWTISKQYENARIQATNTARANLLKDQAFRQWASSRGGLYAEPTDKTPPNPWLSHLPDRDLRTTTGRNLTLLNPATMLRMMMDEFGELYGIKGRIVGLKAVNPDNLADPWETKVIGIFERERRTEFSEFTEINGKSYLRMMVPMYMKPDCMKCHSQLGYRVGDLRGGVNVAVAMEPYNELAAASARSLAAAHGLIWLLGILGIGFAARQSGNYLHEREQQFEELSVAAHVFSNSRQGIVITDSDGVIQRVNRRFTELTGYAQDEVAGSTPRLLKSGSQDQAFYEDLWRNLTTIGHWAGELRNRRKNGELFTASETIVAVHDPDGHIRHFIGMFDDVTDNRRAQTALQESERRFRQLVENTNAILWEMDATGRYTYVSPQAEASMGYPLAQWLEQGFLEKTIHPDDQEKYFATCSRELSTGDNRNCVCEFRLLARDGRYLWFRTISTVLGETDQGRLLGGILLDISNEKKVEVLLRDSNAELEQRVQLRTHELEAAKAEAETANQSKTEFLSHMSHELRTPLNAVLGFAQILANDPKNPLTSEQRDNVDEIMVAGRHLLTLINDVLDLARVESGRLALSLESIDVAELAGECLSLIRPNSDTVRLSARAEIHAKQPILGDRVRVRQVLLNLLSNAVKYNRPGGEVVLRAEDIGDQRVRLSVRDTGEGITPEQQGLLFTPFERLDQHREVEGTGIGLALSRRLVERMNGEIGVSSVPGKGSTFWIELPAAAALPESSGLSSLPQPRSLPMAGRPIAVDSNATVLYIEDNPANRRLVEHLLSGLPGVTLLTAAHPREGLAMAVATRPDLVLLDIHLPDMDGFEVFARLREREATRNVPVIAISANAMKPEIARAQQAGFNDYITKPIDVQRFRELIDRYLARRAH